MFLLFELIRTAIAQRLMEALPVIESLDIVLDRPLGLRLILKLPMPHHLVLERTEEAFHGHIVVADARPVYACCFSGKNRKRGSFTRPIGNTGIAWPKLRRISVSIRRRSADG